MDESLRRAFRQMIRDALASYNYHNTLGDPRHAPELSALVRCLAYAVGFTYHVGYDRPASAAWAEGYRLVWDVVAEAHPRRDSRFVLDTDIDRVEAELLRLSADTLSTG